uniref:Family with sequence similarity 110 member A n=1 Tax=Oryzias sinensis TaxID=183150 RepID=A0A8C7ZBX2_9TELE
MPVEMLQHTARQPTKAAVGGPPPRLRAKGKVGPQFYRQSPTAQKQSAVERLEADKAKYVKSQVALSKQQPIRPTELPKPQLIPAPAVRTTRIASVKAAPTKVEGMQLDLAHLSNLISDVTATAESPRKTPVNGPARADGMGGAAGSPAAGAIRRVDVVPEANSSPLKPPPAFPPPSPAVTRLSSTSSRKRPSLTRSKSDMSDRYSRAGTELERFFNLCGVDADDLQELTGSNADIVSLARFRSVSAPGSECSGSRRVEEEEQEEDDEGKAAERVPYGVSVIERNARVIKWLYGLRQAKDNTTKSTNL